jgi:hypothetical protein
MWMPAKGPDRVGLNGMPDGVRRFFSILDRDHTRGRGMVEAHEMDLFFCLCGGRGDVGGLF